MAVSESTEAFARACTMVIGGIGTHALGTNSAEGLGEISLRDGLVVAAAATGANRRHAWVIQREYRPEDWNGRAIDIVAKRTVRNADRLVYSAEVKWWRDATSANAFNRRRDFVEDLIRAACMYPRVEEAALVILLATGDSYRTTLTGVLEKVLHAGRAIGTWNLAKLKTWPVIRRAVGALRGNIQIPNVFQTEVASWMRVDARGPATRQLWAVAWALRKPQHTHWLTDAELDDIAGP
jgi:hypothetical protein